MWHCASFGSLFGIRWASARVLTVAWDKWLYWWDVLDPSSEAEKDQENTFQFKPQEAAIANLTKVQRKRNILSMTSRYFFFLGINKSHFDLFKSCFVITALLTTGKQDLAISWWSSLTPSPASLLSLLSLGFNRKLSRKDIAASLRVKQTDCYTYLLCIFQRRILVHLFYTSACFGKTHIRTWVVFSLSLWSDGRTSVVISLYFVTDPQCLIRGLQTDCWIL